MSRRDERLIGKLLGSGLPLAGIAALLSRSADPTQFGGRFVDMSVRFKTTSTVIASPATNAETVVATTPAVDNQLSYTLAIVLFNLAYTLGTSASACTVIIRQGTTTGGASKYTTGAQTGGHNSAGLLVADDVMAFDTSPSTQYSVTLTVTGGAATSTVSAVQGVVIYL